MKNFNCCCFYTLIICLASPASLLFAHDGHDHGKQKKEKRVENYNQNYSQGYQDQTPYNYNQGINGHNHSEGCTDCQKHRKINNRLQPASNQNNLSLQPAQNISAFQIERAAQMLVKELRSSSQQESFPEELYSDVNKILSMSQRLSKAEEGGASPEKLYEIAKMIASPMKRVDQYFSFDQQGSQVGTANRDMINMLITYAKRLRKPVRNRTQQTPLRSSPSGFIPAPNPRDKILTIPDNMEGLSLLTKNDRFAALKQRICPVTEEPLGSMGKPIKVSVSGRSIFVCCQGCVKAVKKNPGKYLSLLRNNR
jgi:hypothetical protein